MREDLRHGETGGDEPDRLTAWDVLVAIALAAILLVAGSWRIVPGVVGTYQDDAVYAGTAKALAEGHGYSLRNLPGAPPQTKYPILYPALMAIVWTMAPDTLTTKLAAMQWTTFVLAALALAAAYLYVVRFGYVTRSAAAAAGVVCATSPSFLYFGTNVLSEMPFALLLVVALWSADAYAAAPRHTAARGVIVGCAAGLPFLCRTVGVSLPFAIGLVLALRRVPLRWVAVGAAVVMLPWIAWMSRGVGDTMADPIVGYQTDYLGWWSWTHTLLGVQTFVDNVRMALWAYPRIALEGVARAAYHTTEWARPLMLALGTIPFIALAIRARRLTMLPLAIVAYFTVVLVWPWPPDRFFAPLLFFLTAISLDLLRGAFPRRMPRAGDVAVAVVSLAIVVPNVRLLGRYADAIHTSGYPYYALPREPVAWSEYAQAFEWVREHSGPDDVLAAGFDAMTALYTGRPTLRAFATRPRSLYYTDGGPGIGTLDDVKESWKRHQPRFVVVTPMTAYPEEDAFYELVGALMRDVPGLLTPAYRGSDERFAIFRIDPSRLR